MHRLQKRGPVAPLTPDDGVGSPRRRRLATIVLVALIIVAADQITKTIAIDNLAHGPIQLVGPLSLALSFNSGVAFSIGTGLTLPIIVVVIVSIFLLAWFARGTPSMPVAVGTGLILGGALGNLGDRLFRGHGGAVVDFVHLGFWPTFNLADASIVIGTIVVLISILWGGRHPFVPVEMEDHEP